MNRQEFLDAFERVLTEDSKWSAEDIEKTKAFYLKKILPQDDIIEMLDRIIKVKSNG